jgi:hypothetical protein
MTDTKITKKELQAKIEDLEKELYLYKNRNQLARNYQILQKEYNELDREFKLYKKKEYYDSQNKPKVIDDKEESDEDSE